MIKKVTLIIFLAAFIIMGIAMVYIGAQDVYRKNVLSRAWVAAEAQYAGKEIYVSPKKTAVSPKYPKYWLYYSFSANGKAYTVKTDYITQSIPLQGSTEKIRYNPDNPESVVFEKQQANVPLLIAGLVFLFFPLLLFTLILKKTTLALFLFGGIFILFGLLFYMARFSPILTIIFAAAGLVPIISGIKRLKGVYTR